LQEKLEEFKNFVKIKRMKVFPDVSKTVEGFPKCEECAIAAGSCNFCVTHGEWCSDKVMRDVQQDLKVNHSISVADRGLWSLRVNVFSLTRRDRFFVFRISQMIPRNGRPRISWDRFINVLAVLIIILLIVSNN